MNWKAVKVEYEVTPDPHRRRTFFVTLGYREGSSEIRSHWVITVGELDTRGRKLPATEDELNPETSQANAKAAAERQIRWVMEHGR